MIVRRLIEDFKAYRRGEKRIAPGMRGRVYARKNGDNDIGKGGKRFKSKAVATLHMRVIRADGTVEEIDVPAVVGEPNG